MGFGLLILGVVLWWAAHFFKRVAPAQRAAMGNAGKGAVTAVLLVSIVLMIVGYRATDFIHIWSPPSFMVHINNLLVLIAIWMMSPAAKKGLLLNKVRHPMLAGFKAWATAHLLVNGDLASIILFGGLLGWAVVQVIVINKSEPNWTPGKPGTLAKDGMFFVASIVLMAIIGYIHGLVGPSPFPM
ncbi:NnrU family protein [Phaeobacter sp. NW0010-22]|uniref:NnrU family protein n=1 Tax=Phaeobacter sp. NW0010-22 TaxID=3135907 RepID=UPI00310B3DC0